MSLFKLLLVAVFVFFAFKQCQHSGEVTLGPGVKVPNAPTQVNLKRADAIRFDKYVLTPLADFSIDAKVLSREDYLLGRETDLSPTDLALGWQKMSDEAVLDKIDISQSGRWYRWRVEVFPIPQRAIETQSANMHFIPANPAVKSVLSKVKKGQLIHAEGFLIAAQTADGWHWTSSLSREDTGNGACEVFYVTQMQILTP